MSVKNKVKGGLLTNYKNPECDDSNRIKKISDESTFGVIIQHLECDSRNIDDFSLRRKLLKIVKELKEEHDRRYA